MEALWPESEPEASGTNLRKALHFARLAIGDEQAIVNDHGVLVLRPDAEWRRTSSGSRPARNEGWMRRRGCLPRGGGSVSRRPPPRRPLRVLVGRAPRPAAAALPRRAARRSAVGSAGRRRPHRRAGRARPDAHPPEAGRAPGGDPTLRAAARGAPRSARRRAGPRDRRPLRKGPRHRGGGTGLRGRARTRAARVGPGAPEPGRYPRRRSGPRPRRARSRSTPGWAASSGRPR